MKSYFLKVTDTAVTAGMSCFQTYCAFPSFVFNTNELKQIFFLVKNYYRIQYLFQMFTLTNETERYNWMLTPYGCAGEPEMCSDANTLYHQHNIITIPKFYKSVISVFCSLNDERSSPAYYVNCHIGKYVFWRHWYCGQYRIIYNLVNRG